MSSSYDGTDDIAVVSEATGDIGSAAAKALCRAGATVVMLGHNLEQLETAKHEIVQEGCDEARLCPVQMDINTLESVQRVVSDVLTRFGKMDVLVNAAGDATVVPFLDAADEVWVEAINNRLLGTVRLTRAVAGAMAARGTGRIVIVSGSSRREPDPLMIINGTMSAALSTFAKAISHDLGRVGLRVNVVDPGAIRGPLWDRTLRQLAKRFGTDPETVNDDFLASTPFGVLPGPDDVAGVITFLVSDACQMVNGASLTVDGGASVTI